MYYSRNRSWGKMWESGYRLSSLLKAKLEMYKCKLNFSPAVYTVPVSPGSGRVCLMFAATAVSWTVRPRPLPGMRLQPPPG